MSLTTSLRQKNIFDTRSLIKKANTKRTRAGQRATRDTGKDLVKQLRTEIRGGTVGGSKFDPLTNIGRFNIQDSNLIKGPKRNKPMAVMAKRIRLSAKKTGKNLSVFIGFIPGRGQGGQGILSVARILQGGVTKKVSKDQRTFFHRVGNTLETQGKKKMAKFFHLLPTTKQLRVPARPIIDPFFDANQDKIARRVQANYARLIKV